MKLCNNRFIDIVLKTGRSIRKSKKHNLILKMAIPSLEDGLLFITFLNSHLIISISQVQLSKTFDLT